MRFLTLMISFPWELSNVCYDSVPVLIFSLRLDTVCNPPAFRTRSLVRRPLCIYGCIGRDRCESIVFGMRLMSSFADAVCVYFFQKNPFLIASLV